MASARLAWRVIRVEPVFLSNYSVDLSFSILNLFSGLQLHTFACQSEESQAKFIFINERFDDDFVE